MAKKSQNLIIEALQKAQLSGELIEVIDDPQNPSAFMTVKVLAVDLEAEMILLSIYLDSGLWDGLEITKLANIQQVGVVNRDLSEQREVVELINRGALGEWRSGKIMGLDDLPKFDSLNMTVVLETIAKDQQFCCLDFVFAGSESMYGYINEVEDDCFSISTYSRIGKNEGVATLRIDDVERISFFVTQCEIRERLARARKKKLGK